MEFVETTGKTVDEAKEKALDQLGVHMEDAEFEILEEPKAGLFGRVRGEARVRARVRPAQVRQKVDRRDRKRSDRAEKGGQKSDASTKASAPTGEATGTATSGSKGPKPASKSGSKSGSKSAPKSGSTAERAPKPPRPPKATAPAEPGVESSQPSEQSEEHVVDAHQVGEEAIRFMTGLVEAFGATGTVSLVEDGDDLEVRVEGKELGLLVGPRGTTLQAVQDLARVAAQRRLGDHDTRLRVDIGGYRERRRQALGQFAEQMAAEVKASGVARVLEPMTSADRKIIHDTLAEVEGIATRSEGDDPYRRVIIAPAND